MSVRDSVAKQVADHVALQFAQFGESTFNPHRGTLYVVNHQVVPPIWIELSEAFEDDEPTQPVTMSTVIAYRMPIAESLREFVIEQQRRPEVRTFRLSLTEIGTPMSTAMLEADFTTCLSEVGSSTWSLALAAMMRLSILEREQIAARFGGETVT